MDLQEIFDLNEFFLTSHTDHDTPHQTTHLLTNTTMTIRYQIDSRSENIVETVAITPQNKRGMIFTLVNARVSTLAFAGGTFYYAPKFTQEKEDEISVFMIILRETVNPSS